ncbi:MAG: HsdM family class I SAM-dependent methyltransferase [Planctomycetota bacterium]|jgi:methylase of polypeptide subunit release factors
MANKVLCSVDLIRADGKPIPGLVPVHKRIRTKTRLSIDEQAVVFDAETFEHIDFVFFRRFSDSRSSQVAAYVVDNSNEKLDEKALADLHLQVWLQGTAPLLYVAWPSRVDVLTCARGPDFWNSKQKEFQYKPAKRFELEVMKTASEINIEIQKFSALRLADGTFWDDPNNAKLANHNMAAHQSLIQAVVEADVALNGKNNPVLRRLLLLMVLVKYLEDRKVFPNNGWFGRFHKGARNFFEVLKGGNPDEVYALLDFLEDKFNGEVFNISRISQRKLTKTSLERFADLVEARTLKRQRYLWEQFSFEHLPVEVISHLYQRFVVDGHGAVYTPSFLAALLLDQVMPYKKLSGKERVVDLACGSGVFLVGAFRRLINYWRSQHQWKRPKVETLKRILKQSIYGIDLDPSAVDLTAFSLSLAICNALTPDVIWKELKFDRLRELNLFENDFFHLLLDTQQGFSTIFDKPFDIVIGNPPFESKLTPDGKKVNQIAMQKDNGRDSLPDQQVAYLFLEQALTVLKPDIGRVCLIQPSGFLYNRNVNIFRNHLFQNCQVDTILDFTSIRKLYEADSKTIAIFARALKPTRDHKIAHWTFRRTISVQERICFELDHYDLHHVSQEQSEMNLYVWRANLLGGGRLNTISQDLQGMRTLKEYVNQKKWKYSEGFIVGNKKHRASFLTRKRLLPNEALTSDGIDESKITRVSETGFEGPREKDIFLPPLILIRELETLPIAFWDKGFISYRNEIVGIHAPASDEAELRKLYNWFCDQHDILRFIVMLHGSRSFVVKSTAILKWDIDQLPFPERSLSLDLSFWEKAIQNDVLEYMADYVRLGQNSDLLRKKAEKNDLKSYSRMFCQMLGSVYDNLRASDPVFLEGLICQPFYFGDHPKLSWLDKNAEDQLRKLVYYEKHEHLRTNRIFRMYTDNIMLIVKPDRLRQWIRSTAIRDADETIIDLRHQGY